MPAFFFSTTATPTPATFTVGMDRPLLVFKTGVARKKAYFVVQNKLDKLLITLSDNHKFLTVKLPSFTSEPYTLHAIREGSLETEQVLPLAITGVTGWYFPVEEDGVWYLTVKDRKQNIVAQQVALVNYSAMRQLARYRKRSTSKQEFDRRCYYNGLAILFYECGAFVKAHDMLTLLRDIEPC